MGKVSQKARIVVGIIFVVYLKNQLKITRMKTSLILLFSLFIHGCFAQEVPMPPPPPPATSQRPLPEIIEFPDVEAEFPGGTSELKNFINQHIVYPEDALKKKEQGKVFVAFLVKKDGSIEQIQIERGVSESLNAEAVRLIGLMPKWIPAEMDGKPVDSRCRMPFSFTLDWKNEIFLIRCIRSSFFHGKKSIQYRRTLLCRSIRTD